MKRLLVVLLVVAMTLSSVAFADSTYAEHMSFVATYIDYGVPASEDAMYHYFIDQDA